MCRDDDKDVPWEFKFVLFKRLLCFFKISIIIKICRDLQLLTITCHDWKKLGIHWVRYVHVVWHYTLLELVFLCFFYTYCLFTFVTGDVFHPLTEHFLCTFQSISLYTSRIFYLLFFFSWTLIVVLIVS